MKIKKKFFNTLLEHAIVIEIFTLLTIIVFYKVFVLGFDKWIIGDFGDAWQFIWNIWWVKEKVVLEGNFSRLFYTDYLFYPTGSTLVFHTLSPLNDFIAFPLTYAFNLIATYNILVLVSFVLTGYFGYLLTEYFTKNKLLSLLSGVFITFSPFHVSKALGYFNLLKMEYSVLFLYFYFRSLREREMRYTLISGILLGIVGLSEFQYLYFLIILIGVSSIYFTLISIKDEFEGIKKLIFNNFAIITIGCLVLSPILIPIYNEYLNSDWMKVTTKHDFIGVKNILLPSLFSFGSQKFSFTGEYVISSKIFWHIESQIGFGLITFPLGIFLFLYLLFISKNNKRKLNYEVNIFLFLSSLIFLFLALDTPINNLLPFYSLLATPARLTFIFAMFFPVFIFSTLHELYEIRRKKITYFCLIVLFLDFAFLTFPFYYPDWGYYHIEVPTIIYKIKYDNSNFSILNIPDKYNMHGMYLQTIHDKPILDGHVSRIPSASLEVVEKLEFLTTNNRLSEAYEILKKVSVKYIILDKPLLQGNPNKALFPLINLACENFTSSSIEVYKIC